ncbi:MAG TPA: DUF3667 domain-containing protein [Flavobacterium sp.]|jgi:hypothetical protein|nr:DUF3667 domain-containing protein [Flavobacterium sp.]
MSKNPLRKDKTCLNCKHVVENRFCPNCGQENIDTRKTFYHLFVHFFEDLTHYENAFWKTIINLLIKPSILTKEYLSGKRLSYLAPIRLYIFISLITFFIISFSLSKDPFVITEEKTAPKVALQELQERGSTFFGYHSTKELDSIQNSGSKDKKLSPFQYWILHKALYIIERNSNEEIIEKFKESFFHNLPKLLFVYMPIFTFLLWIFHNKKRWYYFEHGIFTLHYFSFLLLIILILFLIDKVFSRFHTYDFASFVLGLIHFIGYSWMIYYFFPAHHRFYGETRIVSFYKTILFFLFNFIILIAILLIFAFYIFINIH